MRAQTRVGVPFACIAFGVIGAFLAAAGLALFASPLAIAGYGIWIFVWGLAFVIGAVSRYGEARA